MNIDFKNKKVLITGGTRGIGKEIALNFLKLNAKVVITGQSKIKPKDVNHEIFYENLEIIENANWQEKINEIINKYNGFDICINNIGINKISEINELEESDLSTILLTNLHAPIYISSLISKHMIQNKYGFIINIASIFGIVSKEGRNSYTASKAGLIGVTKTMAIDLGKYNIKVNSVSPGFVDTELTRKILGVEAMKEMEKKIPLKKLAKVSDIAPTILFLASDYNTYITGQNIVIDGGFTCE